ncbi:hypothetical protein WG907_15975 [Sphingobium sp. AN558]|uniref:hypothetical protein n=1 Tax=Sphingobium sp. AN558 TaxID=3133442 RepID=UPI0030BA8745
MRAILIPILLLAACSSSSDVLEELPNSSLAGAPRADVPESRMDAPVARPVTIGEDGARFAACGTVGRVTRAGGGGIALRAAPFDESVETGRLAEGDRTFVCTRSLDQKWLGVVVIPAPPAADKANKDVAGADAPATDCGVSGPADRKQAYSGPCASGWVSSAAIRLVSN